MFLYLNIIIFPALKSERLKDIRVDILWRNILFGCTNMCQFHMKICITAQENSISIITQSLSIFFGQVGIVVLILILDLRI